MVDNTDLEERRIASRELMSFLTQYTQMLELQLASVRQNMDMITDGLMDGIQEINQSQGLNKSKAEAVLVKKSKDSDSGVKDAFTEVNSAAVENAESNQKIPDAESGAPQNVNEAGGKFKSYMSSLNQLDGKLQHLLLVMMGTLSSDDIVGQRLEHVNSAIGFLNKGLVGLVGGFDDSFNHENIKKLTQDLQTKVYKSYTMEVEKEIFSKVFK